MMMNDDMMSEMRDNDLRSDRIKVHKLEHSVSTQQNHLEYNWMKALSPLDQFLATCLHCDIDLVHR